MSRYTRRRTLGLVATVVALVLVAVAKGLAAKSVAPVVLPVAAVPVPIAPRECAHPVALAVAPHALVDVAGAVGHRALAADFVRLPLAAVLVASGCPLAAHRER